MSRESDLTQLWLKWVESELSQVSKIGFWVESELSQVNKFGIWVESELSHLDCHISQSRVIPKKWVEHNPDRDTAHSSVITSSLQEWLTNGTNYPRKSYWVKMSTHSRKVMTNTSLKYWEEAAPHEQPAPFASILSTLVSLKNEALQFWSISLLRVCFSGSHFVTNGTK